MKVFEVAMSVLVEAEDNWAAMEKAEESVSDDVSILVVQIVDKSLLGPAKERERAIMANRSEK